MSFEFSRRPFDGISSKGPTDAELFGETEKLVATLKAQGLMIASAESCTGGWLGKCMTDVSGSSDVYFGGVVSYSNALKESFLNVSSDSLDTHGAVSKEVASEMAVGLKSATGAEIAVSITGVAGPGGGSDEKPVGTVFAGVAVHDRVFVESWRLGGETRDDNRRWACKFALDMLQSILSTSISAS